MRVLKIQWSVLVLILCTGTVVAQPLTTRNGFVGFYSKTSMEDIKAENNQTFAVIDTTKMAIAFAVLLKGFIFPRQLMQEHFNENYVESDRFPKATFSGTYAVSGAMNAAGELPVTVKGNLTLHGVTRAVETTATLTRKPNRLSGKTGFHIKPEDYNISIPSLVRDKISKELQVMVDVSWVTK